MDDNLGIEGLSGVAVGDVNINFGNGTNTSSSPKETMNFSTFIDSIRDGTGASLTSYIRQTMISSKVFIQKSCVQSPVLSDLLQCTQQMYISWIFAAVGLNNNIRGSKTKVKDALSLIATENSNKPFVHTSDILQGLENYNGLLPPKMAVSLSSGKILDMPKEVPLPTGRIVELNIATDEVGKPITVTVLVSLNPTFVPDEVMKEYFLLGSNSSISQRWFKYTTGEIRFWRDFLFEMDKRNNRNSALKKDNSGILREIIKRQDSNFTKWISKLFTNVNNKSQDLTKNNTNNRQNIANSILVFSKPDFVNWCKASGYNFQLDADRNKLMLKTMSMMIAVIDDDFNRVEMYFHGIQNKGEYTFDQLASQSKSEKYDLSTVMTAMSRSMAPKF